MYRISIFIHSYRFITRWDQEVQNLNILYSIMPLRMFLIFKLHRNISSFNSTRSYYRFERHFCRKEQPRTQKLLFFCLYFHTNHSRVGRGKLVLRHSVLHFLLNSGGIACWVAELKAALSHETKAKKWKY